MEAAAFSPSQAKALLQRNALNLAKKVQSEKPLSPKEVAMLEGIIAGGDASGKMFAENQVELADALRVNRRTISRWLKNKDCPETRPDGRYDITAWRAFARTHGNGHDDDDVDVTKERARNILLQNEKLEFQLKVLRGDYRASDEVERETAQLIANAKKVLLSGPSSLAPQVVGVSIPEAETLLKQWLHDALSLLSKDPLGKESADASSQ